MDKCLRLFAQFTELEERLVCVFVHVCERLCVYKREIVLNTQSHVELAGRHQAAEKARADAEAVAKACALY